MNSRQRFQKVLQGEQVGRPPVWIMRQAGRYLPEYRELREKEGSFKTLYRNPDLAAEVLMQPIRRFALDAAILFSDILVIPEAMGVNVEFQEGGPILERRIETSADVKTLQNGKVRKALAFTNLSLQASRRLLGKEHALIGFSGAPYTLASYMVEGGAASRTSRLKRMLYEKPQVLKELLQRISDEVLDYLLMQTENEIDAVQIFDTWAGDLNSYAYQEFVVPYTRPILQALRAKNIKTIYFVNGCAALLPFMDEINSDVLAIDWRLSMDTALHILQTQNPQVKTLQGNLDPLELFASAEHIQKRVRQIHAQLNGHPYVMNLGHGILPQTPISGVETFIKEVMALS